MNADDRNEIQMVGVTGVMLNGFSKSFRERFYNQNQTERFKDYWMLLEEMHSVVGAKKTQQIMQIFGKAVDEANEVLKGTSLQVHQVCEVE